MTSTPDIESLPLSEITPYEKNPRDNTPAIDAVAKSIEDYGFLVPIIVDGEGVIVAGHTRYAASQKLGLTEVPVIRAEHLTETQANAFRLIDNKTAELATWDFDLLADEIGTLAESGLDLVPFGWSQEEIDCLSEIVAADCISELPPEDDLARRQDGDGVTGAAQANRGSSAISKDPKSVRVAVGEINFFVDIEQYREWAHELRKSNGFDMQAVVDDLAGRLGLTARKFSRAAAKKAQAVAEAVDEANEPPAAEPVDKPVRKRVRRPLKDDDKTPKTRKRARPKTEEQKVRDAVAEAEA